MLKKLTAGKILLFILFLALFLRVYRLDYPNAYVFDEVYHAFTAKEFVKGSPAAWEWWNTPPPGVAYEWTHPPLAKEIMAASMFILNTTDAWAWRLPGALMGVLGVYLLYLLGMKLFNSQKIALSASFVYSIDGLVYVQSRTGMNDIYIVTFMLASLLLLLHKKFFFSAVVLGFALAAKWTGVYFYAVVFFVLLMFYISKQLSLKKSIIILSYFFIIPPLVYFLSYLPFFLLGHSLDQFIDLHKQMYWYHTNLKASHDYSSPWWSWPLNLYPVWYFVEYHKNGLVSNIFTSGNPLLFWIGLGSILAGIWDLVKIKSKSLLVVLWAFFIFLLPWAFSPRIMFLYHYSPSVPFMCLAVGYQIGTLFDDKHTKKLALIILGLIFISFLLIYPMLTGFPLERKIMMLFFETNTTKNPFAV